MESPSPIFAPSFNFCVDNFFPERKHKVLGEVTSLIRKLEDLPKPKECGNHKSRTKQLLPATNTIVYYWNYGRVWEFYGIVENGNDSQLDELDQIMDSEEFGNNA